MRCTSSPSRPKSESIQIMYTQKYCAPTKYHAPMHPCTLCTHAHCAPTNTVHLYTLCTHKHCAPVSNHAPCVCVHVCMCGCMCVCLCVCMCVCMHACVQVRPAQSPTPVMHTHAHHACPLCVGSVLGLDPNLGVPHGKDQGSLWWAACSWW